MRKIKKGDKVRLICGKDKNKLGLVNKIFKNYVFIEGLNLYDKHLKSNPNKNISGGKVKKELQLHISNVSIYDEDTGSKGKIGFKILSGKNKKKVRYFKPTNKVLDN